MCTQCNWVQYGTILWYNHQTIPWSMSQEKLCMSSFTFITIMDTMRYTTSPWYGWCVTSIQRDTFFSFVFIETVSDLHYMDQIVMNFPSGKVLFHREETPPHGIMQCFPPTVLQVDAVLGTIFDKTVVCGWYHNNVVVFL